jgi:hypothetical protein
VLVTGLKPGVNEEESLEFVFNRPFGLFVQAVFPSIRGRISLKV